MYPISFEADAELDGRSRLTTFFRGLLWIPWEIVSALYALAALIVAIIAWFAIVITGRYPQGLYNFNAGALRMVARSNAFYWLLTDEFPPFGGEENPAYPIRIGVPPALDRYSRLKAGFRFLIGIPVLLLAIVQSIVLEVCGIVAWFAILFTGKLPEGLFNPIRSASAYGTRAGGYFLLMTEDYPPFSYEEESTAPVGQISTEAASRQS